MGTPHLISILMGLFVFAIGFTIAFKPRKKRIKLAERITDTREQELLAVLDDVPVSRTLYGYIYGTYIKPRFDKRPDLFNRLIKLFGIDLDKIEQKIIEAKMEKQITKEEIASMKIFGTAGAILFIFLGLTFSNYIFFMIGTFCYLLGGFVPIAMLDNKIKKRREDIERELPDFLDLLRSVMEAGLVIQEALIKVTDRMSTPLAEEFKMVMAETKASGGQWRRAMENMAFRNNIDALSDVVADILIAYEKGTSITDTLAKEANAIRQLRNFRCQEKAKKLSITLLMPMAIFSFLPLLVLLLSPVLMQLAQQMG